MVHREQISLAWLAQQIMAVGILQAIVVHTAAQAQAEAVQQLEELLLQETAIGEIQAAAESLQAQVAAQAVAAQAEATQLQVQAIQADSLV